MNKPNKEEFYNPPKHDEYLDYLSLEDYCNALEAYCDELERINKKLINKGDCTNHCEKKIAELEGKYAKLSKAYERACEELGEYDAYYMKTKYDINGYTNKEQWMSFWLKHVDRMENLKREYREDE